VASYSFPQRPILSTALSSTAAIASPSNCIRAILQIPSLLKRLFSHFVQEVFYDPNVNSYPAFASQAHSSTQQQLQQEFTLFDDFLASNNFQLTALPIAVCIWGMCVRMSNFVLVILIVFCLFVCLSVCLLHVELSF
jgi:hypothetical protein